jgi:hypothetical protein
MTSYSVCSKLLPVQAHNPAQLDLLEKQICFLLCNITTLDSRFSWFTFVYKRMLRWFPRFQVATICFSCRPPELKVNLLETSFIYLYINIIIIMEIMKREHACPYAESRDSLLECIIAEYIISQQQLTFTIVKIKSCIYGFCFLLLRILCQY